jgi:hypothetical protein
MKKATKIKITRAEGPHYLCGVSREFEGEDCWRSATRWLVSQGHTFPRNGGYDKHDLVVTFEDGEIYEGRLDCMHWDREDNDLNVAKHVRSFLAFLAGERCPAHMSAERYASYLNQVGKDATDGARTFLAEYEIPLC